MKNRREFLALARGAVIGGAAALVGMSPNKPSEPVHVPNDRLPMVEFGAGGTTWTSTSNIGTTYSYSQGTDTTLSVWDGTVWVDVPVEKMTA